MHHIAIDYHRKLDQEAINQGSSAIPSRHTIQVPLLLTSLAAVAILSVVAFFLLQYQTHRTADSLLSRVDELEKANAHSKASNYLRRYLLLVPNDGAAYARLARNSDRGETDIQDPHQLKRLVGLYLRAIGVAPSQVCAGLQKRVCELLFKQERFTLAESHAMAIVKAHPQDREGWRLLAISIYGKLTQRGFVQVESVPDKTFRFGQVLKRALTLNRVDAKMASLLAEVYRVHPHCLGEEQKSEIRRAAEQQLGPQEIQLLKQLPELASLGVNQAKQVRLAVVELHRREAVERARRADQIFEAMLIYEPENAMIWAARFSYREKYQLPGSSSDLSKALELAPQDPRLLLVAGQRAKGRAESTHVPAKGTELDIAEQYFQQLIDHQEYFE